MPLPPLCDPGPPLDRDQVLRYSRHLLLEQFGELGQRRLRAARVLVMGAGGLGSPILHYLAAAGVGHVGIVDDDVVETTNLQRQVLHTTADVGRPKTTSAAEHVRALNPEVEVTEHHLRMDATNAREIIGSRSRPQAGSAPSRAAYDCSCPVRRAESSRSRRPEPPRSAATSRR